VPPPSFDHRTWFGMLGARLSHMNSTSALVASTVPPPSPISTLTA
jgi:hypothetical protein